MTGPIKKTSKSCPDHGRVLAERSSSPLGCGDLLLVIVTLGLWIPARSLAGRFVNPWRCPHCGRRV